MPLVITLTDNNFDKLIVTLDPIKNIPDIRSVRGHSGEGGVYPKIGNLGQEKDYYSQIQKVFTSNRLLGNDNKFSISFNFANLVIRE